MGTLEIFNLALEGAKSQSSERAVHLVERLVAALVVEVQFLWDLYLTLDPYAKPDAEKELRRMFEDWAHRTEAVEQRVTPWHTQFHGFQELHHQYGRVCAMLNAGPRVEPKGPWHTMEEVRRELRLERKR